MLQINKVSPSATDNPGGPGGSSQTHSIDSIARIIKRQFWLFVTLIACSTSLGVAYLLLTPPSFTATSTMVIDTRKI